MKTEIVNFMYGIILTNSEKIILKLEKYGKYKGGIVVSPNEFSLPGGECDLASKFIDILRFQLNITFNDFSPFNSKQIIVLENPNERIIHNLQFYEIKPFSFEEGKLLYNSGIKCFSNTDFHNMKESWHESIKEAHYEVLKKYF